jgi:hypothetical protein
MEGVLAVAMEALTVAPSEAVQVAVPEAAVREEGMEAGATVAGVGV